MSRQILRAVALERLSSPEQLDQTVQVTSPAGWLALVALLALLAGGAAWSLVGTVPEKVSGKGILINPGGVLDVIASTHGRITRFTVHDGDWVERGRVVAEVAQPDISSELEVARAKLAEAEAQYQKLIDFQQRDTALQKTYAEQKRLALVQQAAFTQSRLQWLTEREGLEAGLQAKGLIPSQRIVNTKIEINTAKEEAERVQNDIKHLDIEASTLAIGKEKERIDQEAKIAGFQREMDTLTNKLWRNTQILSPYAGTIMEFKVNAGEVVESGRALFSMLPQEHRVTNDGGAGPHVTDLKAKLYVRPEDGKRVRRGMAVQISPSTVKREEFGFIEGTVEDVAAIPSTEEGILRVLKNRQLVQDLSGGGAPFEVTVDLALDAKSNNGYKWSSSAGPMTEINPGTLAEGAITIRKIRLISLIIPAFERVFEQRDQ